MRIKVNSNIIELHEERQLIALLKKLSLFEKSGMAVAINAEVIPKKSWSQFELQENDEVIIIEAAQGG
ncbi:MAG TPA: sulfur carrier protein ThiS [Chitinophagales bacterium]|nr:sulfur carrier protein ThiS [Chitinophagales bacterium]